MRTSIVSLLLAVLLAACTQPADPATKLLSDAAGAKSETGEAAEPEGLNKVVTNWIGAARTIEERQLRARLLLAGLAIVWDSRLKYGAPAPEDFDLAFSAFSRLNAIQAQLASGAPTLWLNSQMYEVTVQVGMLVGKSLYERGTRAVGAALVNPLALLSSARNIAVQAGALEAAADDVEAIWQGYLAGTYTAQQISESVMAEIGRRLERLQVFMGMAS